jgi:hypothetical protein
LSKKITQTEIFGQGFLIKILFYFAGLVTIGAFRGKKDMRTKALVLILVFLFSVVAGINPVFAPYTADGQGFPLASPISITSPSNSTYSSGLLTLNVTVKTFLNPNTSNVTLVYCIDGKTNTTIRTESTPVPIEVETTDANGTKTTGISIQSYYLITGWATLPEMPEGSHSITVYGKYEFPGSYHNIGLDNSTVYFTIGTNSEQKIPEFPSWIILTMFLIITLCVIIIMFYL